MKQAAPRTGITITQNKEDELLLIEGYGGGGFRVKERKFDGGMWIYEDAFHPHSVTDVKDLTIDHFDPLLKFESKPEIILVGTGEKMALLPSEVRRAAQEKGLVLEMMDTGAAARTYNILLIEGRQVACFMVAIA